MAREIATPDGWRVGALAVPRQGGGRFMQASRYSAVCDQGGWALARRLPCAAHGLAEEVTPPPGGN